MWLSKENWWTSFFLKPLLLLAPGACQMFTFEDWINNQKSRCKTKIYWWEGEMKTDKYPFRNTRFHTESRYLAKIRWGRSSTTPSWNTWRTLTYFLGSPGVTWGQGWPPVPSLLPPPESHNFQCIHYMRYFQSEVHIWQGFEVRWYTSLPTGFSVPPVSLKSGQLCPAVSTDYFSMNLVAFKRFT